MAMELRNRLQTALKVSVAVPELLAGPTLEQLAALLVARVEPRETADVAIAAPIIQAKSVADEWEEGIL
jgi:hypothetical protein